MRRASVGRSPRRTIGHIALALGVIALGCVLVLLRLTLVTDYFYHSLVKDPPRTLPAGSNIVAPADGTVLYVKPIADGIAPEVVKRGVPIPLAGPLVEWGKGQVD